MLIFRGVRFREHIENPVVVYFLTWDENHHCSPPFKMWGVLVGELFRSIEEANPSNTETENKHGKLFWGGRAGRLGVKKNPGTKNFPWKLSTCTTLTSFRRPLKGCYGQCFQQSWWKLADLHYYLYLMEWPEEATDELLQTLKLQTAEIFEAYDKADDRIAFLHEQIRTQLQHAQPGGGQLHRPKSELQLARRDAQRVLCRLKDVQTTSVTFQQVKDQIRPVVQDQFHFCGRTSSSLLVEPEKIWEN